MLILAVTWSLLEMQLRQSDVLNAVVALGTTYMGTGPNGLDKGSL